MPLYNQKRYFGTPANLRYNVACSGVSGEWHESNNALVFKLNNGGALYWYLSDSSIELLGATEEDKTALTQSLPALKDN